MPLASSVTPSPARRVSATRSGMSARPGTGRIAAASSPWRSTPSIRRISTSDSRLVVSMTPRASRAASTSVSMTCLPTPACTAMTDIACATTSCSSRAMRSRSAATAARSRSSRSRSSIRVRSSSAAHRSRRWRRLSPASQATAVASSVAVQSPTSTTPAGWAARETRNASVVATSATSECRRVPCRVMPNRRAKTGSPGYGA